MIVLALQPLLDAVDRLTKPAGLYRFEHVIDRIDFERAHGIFVIGSDERNQRHPMLSEQTDNAEPIEFRHLQIKQCQVGPFGFD